MKESTELKAQLETLANKAKARKRKAAQPTTQLGLPFVELLAPETGSTTRYPTLLTRIPIFSAIRDRSKLDTDWVHGDRIETPWGAITRFGPGIDIFDEDTLIALLRLCAQKRLTGARRAMPVPALRVIRSGEAMNEDDQSADEKITVISGTVTATEINNFLGRGLGGTNLAATRASVRRLALTQCLFENEQLEKEGVTKFFDYAGDRDFRGMIQIQFSPAMTQLLQSYTYLDLNIRRNLTDTGKAIHKFLSAQPKAYEIGLDKLRAIIRFTGEPKEFRRTLSQILEQLIDMGWLASYRVSGTGRAKPYILHTFR